MSQQDVAKFNALPRTPRPPSGRVANEWHFDLRFIHLDPPSHLLFIVQPESDFIHTEMLGSKPMMFFPETGKEAAPEVARGLIRAFLTSFGNPGMIPLAPWKLTTEDTDLATAIGAEFKRLGVRKELWKICVSHSNAIIARESFEDFFKGLKSHMNFSHIASAAVSCPESIAFRNFTPPSSVSRTAASRHRESDDDSSSLEIALAYVNMHKNCIPVDFSKPVDHTWGARIMKEIDDVLATVKSKPEKVVKAEADAGNPKAALDYGFRLKTGLECTPNRALTRRYLVQAALDTNAPTEMRSVAHSALIDWYTESSEDFRHRYLQAASWHANESVKLVPGKTSPSAMIYAQNVMKPQAEHAVDMYLQYKELWSALQKRDEDMEKGRAKMDQKRMARPNRYRCATVGCGIQVVSGHVFSRCSGKCDADKKPYYCGRECREYRHILLIFITFPLTLSHVAAKEKKDWKNHKPFCMPGAPCSVIDVNGPSSIGSRSAKDSIQIPMKFANGRTTMISSSTMSPEFLKGMRDAAEADVMGQEKLPESFTVEMGRLEVGPEFGPVDQSVESEEVD
ncbi:uncharacterized protein BT62DRAFT_1071654 [Guyanagaster necrorhizus]|uniref:MYND-type domain-containing protein n=1 Tax=Guyanagaster necrorhizus TaxID=856835 RepID=A0A9P8AXC0_9AGAR|nr:uncharacterized protein BT62DRAFT_1071654 [Guyanagaster necrorhizus MCA 3950]KAG7451056.1 hypothetical protein BT62DRAFT_1071654 [Guyanagaster necrorhizus MCA 3950]